MRLQEWVVRSKEESPASELFRFLLHPDLRSRFNERIDRGSRKFTQRSTASSRMSKRWVGIGKFDFFLEMNLDNFAILRRTRKMACPAAVKEDMKDDFIECEIL